MIVEVNDTNIRQAAYIHSVSWKDSHRSFCKPDFVEAHTPERQEKYLHGKTENGSKIFMIYGRALAESAPVGIVSVTGNLIEDLYILPDFQRQGYGTELLHHAISECDGVPTLWILENNHNAEKLYRKNGFKETGRRKIVDKGLDEIEFSRTDP